MPYKNVSILFHNMLFVGGIHHGLASFLHLYIINIFVQSHRLVFAPLFVFFFFDSFDSYESTAYTKIKFLLSMTEKISVWSLSKLCRRQENIKILCKSISSCLGNTCFWSVFLFLILSLSLFFFGNFNGFRLHVLL